MPESRTPLAGSIFRRVDPDEHLVMDHNKGCRRIATPLFKHERMSVVVGSELDRLERDAASILTEYPGHAVVVFPESVIDDRDHALELCPEKGDPGRGIPEEEAHGEVCGKKSKGDAKAYIAASSWASLPPGDACVPPGGSYAAPA